MQRLEPQAVVQSDTSKGQIVMLKIPRLTEKQRRTIHRRVARHRAAVRQGFSLKLLKAGQAIDEFFMIV